MPVYDSCDDPTVWMTTDGTVVTADTADYVTPPASIRAETPTAQWWCYLAKWHWMEDWSAYPIVTFWLKVSRVDRPISLMIATGEPPIEHHYPLAPTAPDQWEKFTVDLRQASVEGRVPVLTQLRCFRIDWELMGAGGILHLDQIEFSQVPITPGKGVLECHAYEDTAEVAATVEVVEVGTYLTPFTIELDPGDYLLRATYKDYPTQERTTTIVEGQVTREDFTFVVVVPPPPIEWLPLAVGAGAPILLGIIFMAIPKS